MPTKNSDLIAQFRVRVLDRTPSNDDIDDKEALLYLNEAAREAYRWCTLFAPWVTEAMLSHEYKTVQGNPDPADVNFVPAWDFFQLPLKLDEDFSAIHRVFVGDKHIDRMGDYVYRPAWIPRGFRHLDFTKECECHFKDYVPVTVWYTPNAPKRMWAEPNNGTQNPVPDGCTEYSIFPALFDDLLVIKAQIGYENMRGMESSAEQQQAQSVFQQIQHILMDMNPQKAVGEYYERYQPRGYV